MVEFTHYKMNRIAKIILIASISITLIVSSKYIVASRNCQALKTIISNNLESSNLIRAQLEALKFKLNKISGGFDVNADNLELIESKIDRVNFQVKSLCEIVQKNREDNLFLRQEIASLKSNQADPAKMIVQPAAEDMKGSSKKASGDLAEECGNGGYIVKDSKPTFKPKVRIEVRSVNQNDL